MKKIEVYQCEVCRTQYNNEQDCKECEQSHIKPIRIAGGKWLPKNLTKSDGFPMKVSVVFEDGTTLDYKR